MASAAYLAKHYLTADNGDGERKKSKKRKRNTTATGGLTLIDDDATPKALSARHDALDDDDTPQTIAGHSADFRRTTTSKWKVVSAAPTTTQEQTDADRILADTAAENRAVEAAAEDAPAVVDTEPRAGLQSAASLAAAMQAEQARQRAAFEADEARTGGTKGETVYRDATGRRVDLAMRRREAQRAEEAAKKREAEQKAAREGVVQRQQREDRNAQAAEAKYMPVARGVDDVAWNEELKSEARRDDPMAQQVARRGKGKKRRPEYQGHAPPNRYGIRPGHRWDGVDRGNGFEKEWFAARNRRKNREELEYIWQMDE